MPGLITCFALISFSAAMADRRDLYQQVMISLQVDGEQTLFILLRSDGTVNRSGSGKLKDENSEMFTGKTDEPLFETFMKNVPSYIFDHQGIYDFPDQNGEKCVLTIIFESEDGIESAGFRFDYGYRSGGPPKDIMELVKKGVALTAPWYESQRN